MVIAVVQVDVENAVDVIEVVTLWNIWMLGGLMGAKL